MEKADNDPDSMIYESFSELKRRADLDREQLKESQEIRHIEETRI